jgi:predicted ester cyclase
MRLLISLGLLVSLSAQAKETKMSDSAVYEQNKRVVRRIFEEAVNGKKLELLGELVAEDYTGMQGPLAIRGPAGFARSLQALIEGFPDIHYQLDDLVADGDRVAVRWQWKGTHRAEFHGPGGVSYPPTGNQVANDGMAIFHIKDGKVRSAWLITDRLGFLQMVGALPQVPGPAPKR